MPAREHAQAPDPRHVLGRLGERLAATHFERLGYAILARNVRTRYGEIDLIVHGEQALVFVEVKTLRATPRAARADLAHEPLQGLRPRQRARLRRLAAAWLCQRGRDGPRPPTIRFDAVGVVVDQHERLLRLDHIEGAW